MRAQQRTEIGAVQSQMIVAGVRWQKSAFEALLLDDPALDVDPKRASQRARDAVKRVFVIQPKGAGRPS